MSAATDLGERLALCEVGQAERALHADAVERASANVVRLWNVCPWADALTAYDMQHLTTYNWLLNAESEGVSEREMARIIFRIEVDKRPSWALTVVRTHLDRAHWVQDNEFPYLNW
ncbi:MAG TPA: hypothetical protein VGC36_05215 [Rhizomicrobium sp.]